jgi:hypothetical protein
MGRTLEPPDYAVAAGCLGGSSLDLDLGLPDLAFNCYSSRGGDIWPWLRRNSRYTWAAVADLLDGIIAAGGVCAW